MLPELDYGWDDPPPEKKKPSKLIGFDKIMRGITTLKDFIDKNNETKADKQLHSLAETMTAHRDSIDYDIVSVLCQVMDGEWENISELVCSAYDQAKTNGHDMTQDNGAFMPMLAEYGCRYSIRHALVEDKWPKEKVEQALEIAVSGRKEDTTISILSHHNHFNATYLADLHKATLGQTRSNISNRISEKIDRLINEEYPNIDMLLKAKNDIDTDAPIFSYLQTRIKNTIGKNWQKVSDYEIANKCDAFNTSITRIFNFKANKVHLTTETRHNSDVKLLDFCDFDNKDEIKHAHETLQILSPNDIAPLQLETHRRTPKNSRPSIGGHNGHR